MSTVYDPGGLRMMDRLKRAVAKFDELWRNSKGRNGDLIKAVHGAVEAADEGWLVVPPVPPSTTEGHLTLWEHTSLGIAAVLATDDGHVIMLSERYTPQQAYELGLRLISAAASMEPT